MIKILGDITELGTISGSVGTFSSSLTISGIPVTVNGLNNVVEDATPKLGGDLDTNGFDITAPNGSLTISAFNNVVVNAVSSLQLAGLTNSVQISGEPDVLVQAPVRVRLSGPVVTGTEYRSGGTIRANTGNFNNLAGLLEPLDFGWSAVATGTLVLSQSALYPYTINSLAGQTGQGTVSGTLKVNSLIVGGINDQTWNTTASTKTATSNNSVVIGDRVSFVMSGTSNGDFAGFTLETRRV